MSSRTLALLTTSLLCLVFAADASAQETANQHPLIPAVQLAKQAQNVLSQITDYEATFLKRELIGNQVQSQRIAMRLKTTPFCVYMKFEDPHPGREVLYVAGQNQNQLLFHDATGLTSIAGTLSFALDSPHVMAENRHPITDVGMHRLIELLIAQWELESKYGETDVKFYPNAKLGNAQCEVIEVSHPQPRKQFNFHVTRLFLEKQSRLPIRIENYGFPNQAGQQPLLVEEYTYLNVKTNVGLTATDFDRKNQHYSFR